MQVLKGTAHGVLAADCGDAKAHLSLESAEQGGKRLAPALGGLSKPLEILLKAQIHVGEGSAGRYQLGDRLNDRQIGPVIGALFGDIGIVAPGHQGAVIRMPLLQRDLLHHGLDRRQLLFAAKGHQNAACADRRVKALAETALGAAVEICSHGAQLLTEGAAKLLLIALGRSDVGGDVLGSAVGIQEGPAQVYDGTAVPAHAEPRLLCDHGDGNSLQVFLGSQGQEGISVCGTDHDGHALLALADGELGPVQPLIFLGHGVQVDIQSVGKLTDGHRYAARAKIVAALDHPTGLAVAEEALELALLGSVALLHFCAAGLHGVGVMGLGGAGGAADAVAPGTAAQEDDNISGGRGLPTNVPGRNRRDHRADLHTLGRIAGMIELVHDPRGKADLVAVGGVARCGCGDDLSLRELSGDGIAHALQGICRAGEAHGAVDIGATGERIADGAADAGGGTAEGLDLSGVVVGLVLEQQQPGLGHAIHRHVDLHSAGVDLLALVKLLELSGLLQSLGGDGAQVHQADRLRASQVLPGMKIILPGALEQRIREMGLVDDGMEGRMAAVIGPVGVQHADLCDAGVPAFAAEVVPTEGRVVRIHGETIVLHKGLEPGPVELTEARERCHMRGDIEGERKGLGLFQRGLPSLNGVDDISLDGSQVLVGQGAVERVDLGGPDLRPLSLGEKLDALCSRVRTLVELPRQILHGEDCGVAYIDRL